MIAKIKTGKYFKGAFGYNLKKVDEGKASFFYCRMFKSEHPAYSDMIREFQQISMMCPNVSEPVFHTSINFSPEEYLDDATLQAVVDEYMQRLGYGNVPYVIFKHHDTAHQHVHIISINIEKGLNGKYKKINDSFQKRRSEAISRTLEKKYGLVVATDSKNKKKELSMLIPELKEYGRVATYDQLHDVASYIFNNSKFGSLKELNTLLNKYNIACYKNKDKRENEYYKFTFQNPQTRKNVGISGTPSQLKLDFSSQELDEKLETNRLFKLQLKSHMKEIFQGLVAEYLYLSPDDFDKKLKKYGFIKIDSDSYLFQNNVFTRQQLPIPPGLVNVATLKREYFSNIAKCATEYRKTLKIFHESTMYSKPEFISGFRNFFSGQDTHLSRKQQTLLLDSFISYKINNKEKIAEKEEEKDISIINKIFQYIARLNFSVETARLFLEELNIYVNGGSIVKIGNTVDNVIHEVSSDKLISLHSQGKDYTNLLHCLNGKEWSLVKAAINDRPCPLDRKDIEWERVRYFIPKDYIDRHNLEEIMSSPEYESSQQLFPGFSFGNVLNSRNEYEFLFPKKKKKDESDDEKRKRRRKRK